MARIVTWSKATTLVYKTMIDEQSIIRMTNKVANARKAEQERVIKE